MTNPAPSAPTRVPHTADLVVEDLRRKLPAGRPTTLALSNLERRKDFGINKYGVFHQYTNGRNHILDALEETLDLSIYLRAAIENRPSLAEVLRQDYLNVLSLVVKLSDMYDFSRQQ